VKHLFSQVNLRAGCLKSTRLVPGRVLREKNLRTKQILRICLHAYQIDQVNRSTGGLRPPWQLLRNCAAVGVPARCPGTGWPSATLAVASQLRSWAEPSPPPGDPHVTTGQSLVSNAHRLGGLRPPWQLLRNCAAGQSPAVDPFTTGRTSIADSICRRPPIRNRPIPPFCECLWGSSAGKPSQNETNFAFCGYPSLSVNMGPAPYKGGGGRS